MAVFKLRRPKSQWSAPEVPEFYETYYLKIHGADGKQILRNTHATDKAQAAKVEAAARRKVREDGWQGLMDALEPVKARQTLATLGQIVDAYLDDAVQILREGKQGRQNAASLLRVVAEAKGCWTVAGKGVQGTKPGTRVVDADKVRAMSSAVLTRDVVREYFRARQGGAELDVSTEAAANRSINSTLHQARQLFGRRAMAYKLGKLQLPDLKGFLTEPKLPEAASEPEPLTGAEWEAMVAAEALLSDRELALVNQLLRTTGMRSAEVANLHRSWLVREGEGWAIEIRTREEKKGTGGELLIPKFSQKGVKNRTVPLTTQLAEILLGREGYLIAPGRPRTIREELVNREHNAWLKAMIGGVGEKVQGNHRLRDTVCSALWSLYGPAAAQEAAGHVDPKTTSKHYAKRMANVPTAMASEMALWAPGNVIPLPMRAAG